MQEVKESQAERRRKDFVYEPKTGVFIHCGKVAHVTLTTGFSERIKCLECGKIEDDV